jgi:hypothetical protein
MPKVRMPDGTVVGFPDEMPPEQIRGMIAQKFPDIVRASQQEAVTAPYAGLHDSATGIGDAMTLGFKDEILAGAAAPFRAGYNALTGGGFDLGSAYDTELANQRGIQKIAEKRSPIATTVGQIAGGIASPSMAPVGGAPATVLGMAGRGAGQGALTGGVYGFGSGEGADDRLAKGAIGGATGAAIGGVLGGATGAIAKRIARKGEATAEEVAGEVGEAYGDLRKLPVYSKAETDTLTASLKAAAKKGRVGSKRNAAVLGAIEDIEEEIGTQGLTPGELEEWRKIINSDLISDKSQRRAAMVVRDALDDFAQNNGSAEARALHRQKIQLQKIEDGVSKAYEVARRGSGNVSQHLKTQIGALLNADKRALLNGRPAQFDKEMRDQMKKVVDNGNIEGLLNWLGKASPDSGLGALGHTLTAISTGGTSAIPQVAIGAGSFAAKKAGAGYTQANVDALVRTINKSKDPQVTARARALLKSLTRGATVGTIGGFN